MRQMERLGGAIRQFAKWIGLAPSVIDGRGTTWNHAIRSTTSRGRTRLFGIVGHPIEQVRSPEMFTAEFPVAARSTPFSFPCTCCPRIFDVLSVPAVAAHAVTWTESYSQSPTSCAPASSPIVLGRAGTHRRRDQCAWPLVLTEGWHGDIFDGIRLRRGVSPARHRAGPAAACCCSAPAARDRRSASRFRLRTTRIAPGYTTSTAARAERAGLRRSHVAFPLRWR